MSLSAPAVVKWIRVDAAHPTAFDRAQRHWHHLTDLSGFRGQSGGWSVAEPRRAVVVGLWADRAAHDDFLATAHRPRTLTGPSASSCGRQSSRSRA
jgi:hypothetical protein